MARAVVTSAGSNNSSLYIEIKDLPSRGLKHPLPGVHRPPFPFPFPFPVNLLSSETFGKFYTGYGNCASPHALFKYIVSLYACLLTSSSNSFHLRHYIPFSWTACACHVPGPPETAFYVESVALSTLIKSPPGIFPLGSCGFCCSCMRRTSTAGYIFEPSRTERFFNTSRIFNPSRSGK